MMKFSYTDHMNYKNTQQEDICMISPTKGLNLEYIRTATNQYRQTTQQKETEQALYKMTQKNEIINMKRCSMISTLITKEGFREIQITSG